MTRYVALLRGVNVSGHRKVRMAELRALCSALGYADVETYVQSGNVVLSGGVDAPTLSSDLSTAIETELGHAGVAVLVRTGRDLAAVVYGNPFLARGCDPTKVHFTFLAGDNDPAALEDVDGSRFEPDECAPGPGGVYVHCPNGYGRTKLDNAFFERRLGMPATTRNWKTVTALLAMAAT